MIKLRMKSGLRGYIIRPTRNPHVTGAGMWQLMPTTTPEEREAMERLGPF
jgi:hypothetical protein